MLLPLLMNLGMLGEPVAGPIPARGGSKRIHPRWIKEYDDLESELPAVIRKRTKLTKKVEQLIAKQESITEMRLSGLMARKPTEEEDDWLILML